MRSIIDKIRLQIDVNELQFDTEKKRSPEQYLLLGQNSALRWVLSLLGEPSDVELHIINSSHTKEIGK